MGSYVEKDVSELPHYVVVSNFMNLGLLLPQIRRICITHQQAPNPGCHLLWYYPFYQFDFRIGLKDKGL